MSERYITSLASYISEVSEGGGELKELVREACGEKPRRTSRMIDLSLLGACRCALGRVSEGAGLYMASGFGNIADTSELLRQVVVDEVLPMPLTFINVSSNMSGFYVAQRLGLQRQNIALTSSSGSMESALGMALLDMDCGLVEEAVIGIVEESVYPLQEYRRAMQIPEAMPVIESSSWMVITSVASDSALGVIRLSQHYSDRRQAAEALGSIPPATHYVSADKPPPDIRQLLDARGIRALPESFSGTNASIAGCRFIQALEEANHRSLLYINCEAGGGVYLLWVERLD